MRISDWSSDVCSSDLSGRADLLRIPVEELRHDLLALLGDLREIRSRFGRFRPDIGVVLGHRDFLPVWLSGGLPVAAFRDPTSCDTTIAAHRILIQRGGFMRRAGIGRVMIRAGIATAILSVAGCSSVPDEVNPAEWYRRSEEHTSELQSL